MSPEIDEYLHGETLTWLRLGTRRVVALFLEALAGSHGWHTLFVISPWISEFGPDGGMTFPQLLKRLKDEDATAYIVTRPPKQTWHTAALQALADTGKASIVLVPSLHTKLYVASTDQGEFVLIGSANFTEQSLSNREIGVLIRSAGPGKKLVQTLRAEAAEIYRSPDRTILCKRRF